MATQVTLRDGSVTQDPRLDRLVQFDERSRNFPVRTVVQEGLRSTRWRLPIPNLDQEREGACVGFSITHEMAAYPISVKRDAVFASRLYRLAQQLDQWTGEDYEGTSVLAGMKAGSQLGFYGEYRWAFGIDEVLRAISWSGPVVLGIPWLDSMFHPRPSGLLEVSGSVAGGHAILALGLRLRARLKGENRSQAFPVVRLEQSWGPDWGDSGSCYIRPEDLENLLQQDGECAVPMKRLNPDKN